jgi:peroxin-19
MLDEFSEVKTETKDTPIASGPGRPVVNSGSNGNETKLPKEESIPLNAHGMTDDDFAKQLQAGMADLLGELDTDPDLKGQWETLLKEFGGPETLGKVPGGPAAASSSTVKSTVPPSDESFQETIQKTMERMQASGDKAKAAAVEDDSDDILTELMKQMGAGALGGEGSEEDFSKMLLGMMEQLTNKEILYEPMKELDDKFPDWMEKNKDTTPEEDMKRYKEQQIVVREIVGKFEAKGYADSNAADREYIVERMQKVCHHDSSYFCFVLTVSRCRQQDHLHLTWWVTWLLQQRHSGYQEEMMKVVPSSDKYNIENTISKEHTCSST